MEAQAQPSLAPRTHCVRFTSVPTAIGAARTEDRAAPWWTWSGVRHRGAYVSTGDCWCKRSGPIKSCRQARRHSMGNAHVCRRVGAKGHDCIPSDNHYWIAEWMDRMIRTSVGTKWVRSGNRDVSGGSTAVATVTSPWSAVSFPHECPRPRRLIILNDSGNTEALSGFHREE